MVVFTSYTTVVERTGLDAEFDFSDAERRPVSATRGGAVTVSAVKMTCSDQGHGRLGDQRSSCDGE